MLSSHWGFTVEDLKKLAGVPNRLTGGVGEPMALDLSRDFRKGQGTGVES